MATLLLAEHDNKVLREQTAKAVTAAKALGADVHVLVAGAGCRAVAEAAAKIDGVAKVLLAENPSYEHMLAEPVAALIVSLSGSYDAMLAPATSTCTSSPSALAAVTAFAVCSRRTLLSCSASSSVATRAPPLHS